MRLLDEDTAVQLIEPLQHVLLGHEVAHISDLSWKGKKDLRVLPDARDAGFHVLKAVMMVRWSDDTRTSGRTTCGYLAARFMVTWPLVPDLDSAPWGPRLLHRIHPLPVLRGSHVWVVGAAVAVWSWVTIWAA
jgi:hypothetical protein